MMTYDPAFTNTASCRSAITYIDGDAGILQHRGIPIEQLCEQSQLRRGRLPADLRRAADQGRSSSAGCYDITHHTFVHENIKKFIAGLPLRRASDGDAAGLGRRAVDLLPRRQAHRRPRGALHGGDPADRQDADAGGVRLPPQHGVPVRLPRQRPLLRGQLPFDAVQDDGAEVRARPAARACARRAVHPPRRPRAELLDERRPRRRLLAGRPVLGRRGGRRGALRPAARRRQRGGAADAAPDRDDGEHPRLPRGRQEAARRS